MRCEKFVQILLFLRAESIKNLLFISNNSLSHS